MSVYDNISSTAKLIGNPVRMTMLIALLDGRALPAGELASMAGITAQTASAHLAKLMEGSLIVLKKSGKHRYYMLTNSKVAEAVEAIAILSPPSQVKSLKESTEKKALYAGRTCYGHLAGEIGIKFTQALIRLGYVKDLQDGCLLTENGLEWMKRFGINPSRKMDNTVIPYHVDWTARKFHIAGPFALAITNRLLELGWIKHGKVHRSIQVTDLGQAGITKEFGFDPLS